MRIKLLSSTIIAVCFLSFVVKTAVAVSPPVRISEFLPNPVGDDTNTEWIELENPTGQDVLLTGWIIADVYGTVRQFKLDGKTIRAHEFLVLDRSETGISLNNDIEQIALTSPDKTIVLSGIASSLPEGKSLSLVADIWIETTPTRGLPNVAPSPSPSPTPTPSSTPSPSPTPTPSPTTSPTSSSETDAITLSEISACTGSSEWVELHNLTNHSIDLDGWEIRDASQTKKPLDSLTIPAHGFVTKTWTDHLLNNSGDTLSLFYQDALIESFTYKNCTTGTTWAKTLSGEWQSTIYATPGEENQFGQNIPPTSTHVATVTGVPMVQQQDVAQIYPSPSTKIASGVQEFPPLILDIAASRSSIRAIFTPVQKLHPHHQDQTTTSNAPLLSGMLIISGGLICIAANLKQVISLNDLVTQIT